MIPNSALIEVRAGAIIEEDIGETSVKHDTIRVAAHLRFIDPDVLVSNPSLLPICDVTHSSWGSSDHRLTPMSPKIVLDGAFHGLMCSDPAHQVRVFH